MTLPQDDPVAVALQRAIQSGDLDALQRLLADHPGLAGARIGDAKGSRTPLLIAADWPGYFPNGARVVAMLIAAGADPNDPTGGGGPDRETPLHYAASTDDAEVAKALIDGGADIEVAHGSIADGTPLTNAVGYGCWQVADLLVAHGAKVEALWQAAALGRMADVEAFFAAEPGPSQTDINEAFYQACRGGQPRAAASLLERGADLNSVPTYAHDEPPLAAASTMPTRWGILASWLREKGAKAE